MDVIDDGPVWITLAWHQRGRRGRRGSIGVVDDGVTGWGAVGRHLDHPFGPVLMLHVGAPISRPLARLEEDGWEIVDTWEVADADAARALERELTEWWRASGERPCAPEDIPAAPPPAGAAIHARPTGVQATWEHLARAVMAARGTAGRGTRAA